MMERNAGQQRVMIDAVWPNAGISREVMLVLGGGILIALAAQIRIPVPFSPVPITGQTFAVLFLGALYGSVRGVAAVLAYLTMGFAGLPVFAGGIGAAILAAPTAGYLLGYLPASFIVGRLSVDGSFRSPWRTAAAMALGNVIIYAFGVAWLSRFVALEDVLRLGAYPFLVGDAVKIGLATLMLPAGWKLIGARSR